MTVLGHQLGDRLIALGELIKNPDSAIDAIAAAAHDCGLRIVFRLEPYCADDSTTEPQDAAP